MDLRAYANQLSKKAREAAVTLARASTQQKNDLLRAMAKGLRAQGASLAEANAKDLEYGQKVGLTTAMVDRLRLDAKGIDKMAAGLEQVAELQDPVGEILHRWSRPNGIQIEKVRVPLGVIFMIYESRPNVTADAAGLCLKAGNAVILRGGKEAVHSNVRIAQVLRGACEPAGISPEVIQVVEHTDRELIDHLLGMTRYIDLVIPRGGEALIRRVAETSKIPVIKHYKGLCILYVDKEADLAMAQRIVVNAKTQRPGVCNALETVLVHRDVAAEFLPRLGNGLEQRGVEIRASAAAKEFLPTAREATPEDFDTEYLDLVLAVKTVRDMDEAVLHIDRHGSHHSDGIITDNRQTAERFTRQVDSSAVFVNASTRFHDGGEFGFGAEIGISTDKLHARGPMALPELTSYKYIVRGNGQIRE